MRAAILHVNRGILSPWACWASGCATLQPVPNNAPETASPPSTFQSNEIPAEGDEALSAPAPTVPAGGYPSQGVERVPSFGDGEELEANVRANAGEGSAPGKMEEERAPSFGEGAELLESDGSPRRRRLPLDRPGRHDENGGMNQLQQGVETPAGQAPSSSGSFKTGSASIPGSSVSSSSGASAQIPDGASLPHPSPNAYPGGPPASGYGPTPRLIPIIPPTPPALREGKDNQLEQTVYWMQTEVYGIQITLIGRPLLPRIGERLIQLEGYANQVSLLSQGSEETRGLALQISQEAAHIRQLTNEAQRRELESSLVRLQQLLQQLRVVLATR